MLLKKSLLIAALLAAGAIGTTASAAPASSTFQVLMTVTSGCTVAAGAGSNITLGTVAATSAVGTGAGNSFSVTCSNSTPYNIGLQSQNNSSTAGLGTLKGTGTNTDTLTYQLYYGTSSAGTVWGNNGVSATARGNGQGANGNGTAQSYNVWAQVASATPAAVKPDNYSDTVNVNVYF